MTDNKLWKGKKNVMKKTSKALTVFVIVALLLTLFSGCSGGTGGTNNNASSGDNWPTPENPITLKCSVFMPEATPIGQGFATAAKRVAELTDGAVLVDVFYDATLVSFGDTFQGVSTGMTDIASIGPAAIDTATQLNQIFGVMQEKVPGDIYDLKDAFTELIETVPALNEELAGFNLKWICVQPLIGIGLGATFPINSPDDLKGKSIQAIGEVATYFSSQFGAQTQALDASDYYVSLERGIVDACYDCWTAFYEFGLTELMTHYLNFGEGGISSAIMGTLVNTNSLAKLSPEQQAHLYAGFNEGIESVTMALFDAAGEKGKEDAAARGATIITLEGAALQPYLDAVKIVRDAWIAKVEAAGWPAQETYDKMTEILAKY